MGYRTKARRTDEEIDRCRKVANKVIARARQEPMTQVQIYRLYGEMLAEAGLPELSRRAMQRDLKKASTGAPRQKSLVTMKARARRDLLRERKQKKDEETAVVQLPRGERYPAFEKWAENMVVPDGILTGDQFQLAPFQKSFLREALDGDASESWMVIARGNMKTSTGLLVAAAYLFGPLNGKRLHSAYLSLDGQRSRLAYEWLAALAEDNKIEGVRFVKSPIPTIYGWNGCDMIFIASGTAGGHSLNLTGACFLDEVGLWEDNRRGQLISMRDAASKGGGRIFALTVRGYSDFVTEAQNRSAMDFVNFISYEGSVDLPIDDPENWRLANPALEHGAKSIEKMRENAESAKMTPAELNDFRAFQLNLPLDPDQVELVPLEYVRRLYDPDCNLENEGVFLGIDFGGEGAMTAAVAVGKRSGRMRVWGVFPTGELNLRERGLRDGVGNKYELMARSGELWTHPTIVVDYISFVDEVVRELMVSGCQIVKVGSDRYNVAFLKQALDNLGLVHLWEPRGTGAGKIADGSADVRSFQRCVAQKKLSLRENLLFEEGMKAARLRMDMGGNFAVDKRRWNHRQDIAVAACIAVGFFDRQEQVPDFVLEIGALDYA